MALDKSGTQISNASNTAVVPVWATVMPESVDDVCEAIKRSTGRLSVSSTRYSPDRQFALDGALHIDMTRLAEVIRFQPIDGVIRVQAGIRWSALLRFIQPHGFAVRVMPQFANFSVGGSIAANAHGTYVGVGPISHSIRSLKVILASGAAVEVGPTERADLFAAIVGGMGGVGVIVEVELQLTRNSRVLRKSVTMPADRYVDHFKARIATDPGAVFHSADFTMPSLRRLRSNTWVVTEQRCSDDRPLRPVGADDPLRKVFDWSRAVSWIGRLHNELIVEPIRYSRKAVHWRNFEASQDLLEFDARINTEPLLELQEYVIGAAHVPRFLEVFDEIVGRFKVPAAHLSIRHYGLCPFSCLSLADRDSFAILLAVRAAPADTLRADYSVWSRELVDLALSCEGRFNPAYMMHATAEQFCAAFPRRAELLAAKRKYDPDNRFGNGFWSRYLDDDAAAAAATTTEVSEFRAAFANAGSRDTVYRLLAECGPAGYAPRMIGLLQRMAQRSPDDELIYRNMRSAILKWRSSPWAALLMRPTGWTGTLHRRLARFARERLEALPGFDGRGIDGCVEVGTRGAQVQALRRILKIGGNVRQLDWLGAATATSNSRWLESRLPARTMVGGAMGWADETLGAPASVDLVTVFGGLAGVPASLLEPCLGRLATLLRPGGQLLLLEHDVASAQSGLDASMAVTIASLCAGEGWEACQSHGRQFRSADDWGGLLAQHGLVEHGKRERLGRTPGGDVLMAFSKTDPRPV